MITEKGRVVAIENDCLWVETIRRSACDSCSAEKGCGQKLIARMDGHSGFIRVLLEGRASCDFAVDDEVTLGIPDDIIASSSMIVYLTPLFGLVAGALLAEYLSLTEAMGIFISLMGFAVGAALVRCYSFLKRNDSRFQPFLVDTAAPVEWRADNT